MHQLQIRYASGSSLGAMAPVGRGFTFVPFNRPHALENRWRLDVQRQIKTNFVLNIGYAGSYSDNIPINQTLSALPAQYMWFGNTRNDTVANNLNERTESVQYLEFR